MELTSDYVLETFLVRVGQSTIEPRLVSPPAGKLADRPSLLFNIVADWKYSLFGEKACLPTQTFLKRGHRVVSFDLPNHGTRIDRYGDGLAGLCNAILAGQDPFARFIDEATAVIDHCLTKGFTETGRILLCGASRGGYFASRLLATDPRIQALALFQPVTDWRDLTEFSSHKDAAQVADLRLANYAGGMTGKPIYITIGNHDRRVSTVSCCDFFVKLVQSNLGAGLDEAFVDFYCTGDPSHELGDEWFVKGAEFLLDHDQRRNDE